MSSPNPSPTFKADPLPKSSYSDLQSAFDDFVKGLNVVFPEGFLSRKGDKGDPGVTLQKTSTVIPITSGQQLINLGSDSTDCTINLISSSVSPTIGILCLVGNQTVKLTAAAPDNTYSIKVTSFN